MKKYLAFAFFAVAILSSMIREWGAPNTCPLPPIRRATALVAGNSGEAGVAARLHERGGASFRQGN